MKIKSYLNIYDVEPVYASYQNNGSLAIQLIDTEDGCPFGTLTVNLEGYESLVDGEYAFVDTNNIPNAEEFIIENGLGAPTGIYGHSGYCEYPLYRFNRDDK